MNYYPFHVGDYAAHTAHLEPMEDLAYRRMLDLYYLREGALPADPVEVARLIRMKGFVDEVSAVLNEFFTLLEGGWTHARCEAEVFKMQDKQAKAQASGKASAEARRAKSEHPVNHNPATAERPLNDRSANVQLPTPTPTPIPNKVSKKPLALTRPEDVPEKLWTDFVELRRAKKAPLTASALAGLRSKGLEHGYDLAAVLVHCCEKGHAGFYPQQARASPQESFEERSRRAKHEQFYRNAGLEPKPTIQADFRELERLTQ